MEELKNDSSKRFKKLKTNPKGSIAFTMPMQLMDSVDLEYYCSMDKKLLKKSTGFKDGHDQELNHKQDKSVCLLWKQEASKQANK